MKINQILSKDHLVELDFLKKGLIKTSKFIRKTLDPQQGWEKSGAGQNIKSTLGITQPTMHGVKTDTKREKNLFNSPQEFVDQLAQHLIQNNGKLSKEMASTLAMILNKYKP